MFNPKREELVKSREEKKAREDENSPNHLERAEIENGTLEDPSYLIKGTAG